jgi:CheY-like chemotaxis protein
MVDAVIVDLGLPDKKGDVLVREIRAVNPFLPIVLATGQSASPLLQEFKAEKNIALTTKPYTASDLLRALGSIGIRGNSD